MKLIRGITNLKFNNNGCIATIGNFDGLHQGHQALLSHTVKLAKSLGLPSVLITFEPHPQEFFRPQLAAPRLTRLREKLEYLQASGIDQVLVLHFNAKLADMSAEDFVRKVLVKGLHVQHLIVGDDFHFGKDRKGDFAFLQQQGEHYHFSVESTPTLQYQDRRISSQWVREALQQGDLNLAEILLARPYVLTGKVAHGNKKGRELGFPTANIHLFRRASPLSGVFAVKVHGINERIYYGAANVGNRPTISGGRVLLEIHIFDLNESIYGKHLQVEFVKKLRDEKRYDNLEVLVAQIAKDVVDAKRVFE